MKKLLYVTTVLVAHALVFEASAKTVHQNNLGDLSDSVETEWVDVGDTNGSVGVTGAAQKPAAKPAPARQTASAVAPAAGDGKTRFEYEGKTLEYDRATQKSKEVEGLVKKEANIAPKTGGEAPVKGQPIMTTSVKEDPGSTVKITANGDGTFTLVGKGGTTTVTRTPKAEEEENFRKAKNLDPNKPQKLGEILGNVPTAEAAGIQSFVFGKPISFSGVTVAKYGYYNVVDKNVQDALLAGGNPIINNLLVKCPTGRLVPGVTVNCGVYGGGGGGGGGAGGVAGAQPPI